MLAIPFQLSLYLQSRDDKVQGVCYELRDRGPSCAGGGMAKSWKGWPDRAVMFRVRDMVQGKCIL
jgi:hypothetical protein